MGTEATAAAVQTVGFLHPVMADVMTILSFVLVVASVAIAAVATHYAWRQTGGTVDVIEGHVSWLRTEAERLSAEIQASVAKDSQTAIQVAGLKEQVGQLEIRIAQMEEQAKLFAADLDELKTRPVAAPPPPPEPEPEPMPEPEPEPAPEPEEEVDLDALLESKPIWQDLLDDYHALRETFSPERGAELCQPLIDKYALHLLICSDHAATENGKTMPKFETVDDVNEATFWAYDIPGQPNDFAVIPSPMFPYDQKMHEEAGMKETFAARYEVGKSYDKLTVDMPALFSLRKDKWNIEQPGLLKFVE
ncbi:hypothetical protein [Selenomonas sp. oral taxon 138]|uniref:hypothetical protein n=1 Tax=Selenomonas sp. oral taxon 138 TaxID=712532 RepID=UPI0002A30406|nr:hypothetical protein [Selenomonas sp. oral taxon 138]EKX95520.1 hypothetical protein HMPREF9163_02149 [Selenomonas sp. oral taxon 138 str. F0429]